MGGGIGMGNTCKPMAVSFQCMTKFTTNKKKKKKRITGGKWQIVHVRVEQSFNFSLTKLIFLLSHFTMPWRTNKKRRKKKSSAFLHPPNSARGKLHYRQVWPKRVGFPFPSAPSQVTVFHGGINQQYPSSMSTAS